MEVFLLISPKQWHNQLFENLSKAIDVKWLRIGNKEDFTVDNLKRIAPTKIFIPHWSHIIPSEIYNDYECIVFHMTDLPYGRGGSPLQNLIVKGHKSTKISALKVQKGLDTGDIYLKKGVGIERYGCRNFRQCYYCY